ncbi:MAG TPA: ArgE/DapE family deacylase [Bryobacteraceae bacterium]|nr:ArgE/DapE family deacylase [Bryobacteraceae bacterium]
MTLAGVIEQHRDAMIDFARRLIAIPTENPPGNCYPEAAALIRTHLEELGFEAQVSGACILTFIGDGPRTLYFSGHYDVVPAQDRSQFEPVMKGANLFGRGSSDMKAALASMIYAAKSLRDTSTPLNGRLGLVFVPDEETAGPLGSRHLASAGLLGQDAIGMLTPEPTGGIIWNANRGAITLKITVKGKSAHVGRQAEGINAFEGMLSVAARLQVLKHEVESRTTAFRLSPDPLRRSVLMLGGCCQSGSNFNVVPEVCSFTVDRRINPEENLEEEKRRLISVLDQARAAGIDLQIETIQDGESAGSPEDGPVAVALARNIENVTGRPAQFEMCPGLLETRFYAARGIPAFAYGPGLLTVSHGPNEFVPIDRIVQCASIYAQTAAELLS